MAGVGEWEAEAERWVRWARTSGHDAYWYYRDEFFDAVVPPAGRCTLEVGCGEGRVSRDLAARGHRVVALDSSATLVRHARDADADGAYTLADSAALPVADGGVDVVVAYNVLQVVPDMPGTLREAARVLEPGGALCICIVHPVTDLGQFVEGEEGRRFIMRPEYFRTDPVDDTVEKDGLTMRFHGWTHTLEAYSRALEGAGFRVEMMREPQPLDPPSRYESFRSVPLFLNLRAIKGAPG